MTPCISAYTEAHISVAVAHKDPLVRAGLAAVLTSEGGFLVSVVAVSDTHGRPDNLSADVVVTDYETALTLCAPARYATANGAARIPRVMIISHRDRESEIRRALDLGVHGYLLLGCELAEMILGVRALHRGQRHLDQSSAQRVVESLHHEALTSREVDVLHLICAGCVNKTIADQLNISLGTVKAHVKTILAKLRAKTRTEAASIAQRRGLIASHA